MKKYFKKKRYAFIVTTMMFSATIIAQTPSIQWQKCIGGSKDEFIQNVIKLSDGNYLSCGNTNSHNGDFNAKHGDYDAFLMKTNGAGHIIWKKIYGGSDYDAFYDMVETSNGDIYAIGATASIDGQVSGLHGSVGSQDVWLAKVNSKGALLSQHCYGGSGDDYSIKAIITQQGNVMFVAITSSNDGDVSNNHGDYDGWVVKLNTSGTIDFSVTIGDTAYDDLTGLAQVNGGFFVTGITSPQTGDLAQPVYDDQVAKLNQSGGIIYYRKYGGTKSDDCNAMVLSSDGNAVLTGHTSSSDGDVTGNYGFNVWVLKIDVANNGNILWQNFFGMPNDTAAGFNITTTHDSGFVIVGAIAPNKQEPLQTWDAYAGKVDANGNLLWTKRFGGNKFDIIMGVVEENDQSILMAGATKSNNGDVHGNHGGPQDAWLVNLSECGQQILNPYNSTENNLSREIPPSPETVVSCLCSVPGFGCGPLSTYCKMACGIYCRRLHVGFGQESSSTFKKESFIKVYPNPVFGKTTITFSLEKSEKISVKIFDITGRFVKSLTDNFLNEGRIELNWNTTDENENNINPGIYFLKFDAQNYSEVIKIIVSK